MVCRCSGITVQIKNWIEKEQTIDTGNNLDGSQGVMVSEEKKKSQSQKVKYFLLQFMHHSWNDGVKEMETHMWLGKEGGVTLKYLQRVPLCWKNNSISWLGWWLYES